MNLFHHYIFTWLTRKIATEYNLLWYNNLKHSELLTYNNFFEYPRPTNFQNSIFHDLIFCSLFVERLQNQIIVRVFLPTVAIKSRNSNKKLNELWCAPIREIHHWKFAIWIEMQKSEEKCGKKFNAKIIIREIIMVTQLYVH